MSSTNKTQNYELSQYVGTDKPTYLGDYNSDMLKIDTRMKANHDLADGASSKANSHDTMIESIGQSIEGINTKIGDLNNLSTEDKTSLVNAINEIFGSGITLGTQYDSNSVQGASSTPSIETICSLSLNEGTYLLLGSVDSTANSSDQLYMSFGISSNVQGLAGNGTYRGTMENGGGLSGWRLVKVNADNSQVYLSSMVKNAYSIRGHILAIKLS